MFLNFSLNKVEQFVYQAGSTLLQTGTGYVSGHVINSIYQWLHPGKVILGQPLIVAINPWMAGVCVGLFALVDLVAKKVIEHLDVKNISRKPLYQLIRMAVSVTVSSLLASLILGITFQFAVAAIVSSLIASALLLQIAKVFSKLIYQEKPYGTVKC
jgi:hypothetical protein